MRTSKAIVCPDDLLQQEQIEMIHHDNNDDDDDVIDHDGNESQQQGFDGGDRVSQDPLDVNECQPDELSDDHLEADEFIDRETLESPPPSGSITNSEGTIGGRKSGTSHSLSLSSLYRRNRWVPPFLAAAFVCLCLVSSVNRPYDVILERRQRSFQSRRIFVSFPSSLSSFVKGHGNRLLGNYYNVDDGDDNYKNKYYGDGDGDGDGNNKYYGDGDGDLNNDDGKVDDASNDDVADDKADDYSNDDVADDAANETYYEEPYYEPEIDDFFRYIDDSVEMQTVFPLEVTDYAGFICASLSIILSVGGGIGPGAILVAVFIIVMDFQPKVAIPLSCMTGLGVTFIATVVNMRRRHPLSDRPLIDWDLVLIMEPLTLFGAIAGTYINKILGQKVLITLLVLLLSLIAHNTLKKARKMHHAEELYIKRMLWARQKKRNSQHPILATIPSVKSYDGKLAEADPPFIPKVHPSAASPSASSKGEPLLEKDRHDDNQSKDSSSALSNGSYSGYSNNFKSFIVLRKEDAESVKSSLIEEEADPLPQNKITYIFTMFLGVIAFNVFKGGAGFESPLGIVCGSAPFWIIEFMTTIWLGCCAVLAARYLLKRHAIKEAVGFDYVRGDIRWDVRTIAIYPIACVVAGLVSGMFGIGCAVLIAPMLVGIGVNPQVAAATCACMNFFTSLAATSSFVVLGSLTLYHQYAIVLFFVGILSLFTGKWVMSYSIHSTKIKKNKRLERHSYMAYSMGLVVLVSALSMTVEALLDVLNHSYDDEEIDGICDV